MLTSSKSLLPKDSASTEGGRVLVGVAVGVDISSTATVIDSLALGVCVGEGGGVGCGVERRGVVEVLDVAPDSGGV